MENEGGEIPTILTEKITLPDWETGVEAWQKMNVSDLCTFLGVSETTGIITFNTTIDPLGVRDPWLDPEPHPDDIPLTLHWHQWIGIVKIMVSLFEGDPVLLMDAVGLGKTMQVVGVIALLDFYRTHKQTKGHFPGWFRKSSHNLTNFALTVITGDKRFQGMENIPNAPFLLVVPLALRAQWEVELHRYLRKGSLEVIVYDSGSQRSGEFWQKHYHASQLEEGKRIILATAQAVANDGGNVIAASSRPIQDPPKFLKTHKRTIFDTKWLFVAVDEIHNARNTGRYFRSLWALRQRSMGFVGMTATPVLTRPQVSRTPTDTLHKTERIAIRTSGISVGCLSCRTSTTSTSIRKWSAE